MTQEVQAKGIVRDRQSNPIQFAKVVVVDRDGNPVIFDEQNIGTITDDEGKFVLKIPYEQTDTENILIGSHLLALTPEGGEQTLSLSEGVHNYDFIVGIIEPSTEVATAATPKINNDKPFNYFDDHFNQSKLIIGVVSLVLLSLIIAAVSVSHNNNK